jgi:hypothetical protein
LHGGLSLIVAGDMKSSQKRSLSVKWHLFVTMVEEVQILRERATRPRYTHNTFLVILDVAILDDL